jgi:hypothetical protein
LHWHKFAPCAHAHLSLGYTDWISVVHCQGIPELVRRKMYYPYYVPIVSKSE